jgi:hypothetical protein
MITNRISTALLALMLAIAPALPQRPANASQDPAYADTSVAIGGLALMQLYNLAHKAAQTCNSGSAAPDNLEDGAAAGQCWADTSVAGYLIVRMYDGTSANWIEIYRLDLTNHILVKAVGGGTVPTLSSATTTDLGSVPQPVKNIGGTTTITSFGSSAQTGSRHTFIFTNILTLTHNATSLIIPGATSITTAAGDLGEAIYLGSGNWRVVNYTRANGTAVSNPAVPVGTGPLPTTVVTAPTGYAFGSGQAISRASFPDWLAAVTSIQSVTRTSGSPTLTGFTDTTRFGYGMPIEGTGINAGTQIKYCTGSTCTMSANAASSGTNNATVFVTGYGSGGDSTTVGVPACNGRAIVFRDNSGGTAANVSQVSTTLTTTASSTAATAGSATGLAIGMVIVNPNVTPGTTISALSGTAVTLSAVATASGTTVASRFSYLSDAQALNAIGGSPTHTIAQVGLPSYTLPNTLAIPSFFLNVVAGTAGGSGNAAASITSGILGGQVTLSPTISGGVQSGGSGLPTLAAAPALVADCMYRVTP